MKVENMINNRNNVVKNQFKIYSKNATYFQSYNSIIAVRNKKTDKITLDSYYWDYSVTTGKYRNAFLGENIYATRDKIEKGKYILKDLN